ncbi:hypothetical protein AMTR_s00007p00135730 [Amborella trichopoda]|uniref:Uncharacterized protein n=1 Tax=Amborella trichopoda TaxID=13333 RepID=W1P5Z3_AMBTC|nr:hypothetical protein AMTR_s00007p00135730 [Amborella trichopoda]
MVNHRRSYPRKNPSPFNGDPTLLRVIPSPFNGVCESHNRKQQSIASSMVVQLTSTVHV